MLHCNTLGSAETFGGLGCVVQAHDAGGVAGAVRAGPATRADLRPRHPLVVATAAALAQSQDAPHSLNGRTRTRPRAVCTLIQMPHAGAVRLAALALPVAIDGQYLASALTAPRHLAPRLFRRARLHRLTSTVLVFGMAPLRGACAFP